MMLPELTRDEISRALDEVAAEVLALANWQEPPVDALTVARALGMAVAWDDRQEGRARLVRLGTSGGRGSIFLRPEPRQERRHWAVAHEIGEAHAQRVFALLGVDPHETAGSTREKIANQLAGRILLPSGTFFGDARDCGWDLHRLKERYATASHELVARRMLDGAVPVIITIFDQGRRTFRRSNQPGRLPPLSAEETACWRQVQQSGCAAVEELGMVKIQGWPIHEESWKREILRRELPEEFDTY